MPRPKARSSLIFGLLFLAAGCQGPPDARAVETCEPGPLDAGETLLGRVGCSAALLGSGEGRTIDSQLANGWLRAIVRHPSEALTLVGLGGGTVIDAAPWGFRDRLHEVAPLVGGGWLDVDTFEEVDGGLLVGGTIAPLPGRPAEREGDRAEIVWTIDADGPWLRAVGAEGLYLHASETAELLDGQLWTNSVLYGHDGTAVEDLGGAIVAHGASGLLISPTTEAAAWLPGAQQTISGSAPGAERVALLRDGETIGFVGLVEGGFELEVPADIDGVRAEAEGRIASPVEAPGLDLALAIGASGAVRVDIVDGTRPVLARWSGAGVGEALLGPSGGVLPTGPGVIDVVIEGGPTIEARTVRVDVAEGAEASVGVTPERAFDPGDRVLAALPWVAGRSRSWRGTDREALDEALAAGIGYAVLAPEYEVAAAVDGVGAQWVRSRNGSTLVSPDGWSIVAWPWTASARQSGHGAVDPTGLSPEQALGLVAGGAESNRLLAVDLAWLEAAGPPHAMLAPPDVVRLGHPGDSPSEAWAGWFRWLDAARPLVPVGPLAWVDVGDADAYGPLDVEAGLLRGRSAATTGPLLVLEVLGAGPGEVVGRPWRRVGVHLELPSGPLENRVILGEGGRVVGTWDGTSAYVWVADPGRYVVAVAWDADDFVVAGPVWLETP